jgi:hypothetical protein
VRLELLNDRGTVVTGVNDIEDMTRTEIFRWVLKVYGSYKKKRGRPETPPPDDAWMN